MYVDRFAFLALQLLRLDDRMDDPARGLVQFLQNAFVGLLVFEDRDRQGLNVLLPVTARACLHIHKIVPLRSLWFTSYRFVIRSFNCARVSRSTVRRISVSRLS